LASELLEMSRWCWVVENRCVFSAPMKASCDSSGAHNAGGRLLQVVGPMTAKLHWPAAVWMTEPIRFNCMWSSFLSLMPQGL